MKQLTYRPGGGLAVIRPGVVILVEDAGAIAPGELWDLANSDPDVLALIDVLGAGKFSTLPSFASVMWTEKAARIVVRGDHAVELVTAGGTVRHDGAGVSTWSEHNELLDGVLAIQVTSGGELVAAEALPVGAAVVRASAVLIGEGPSKSELGEAQAPMHDDELVADEFRSKPEFDAPELIPEEPDNVLDQVEQVAHADPEPMEELPTRQTPASAMPPPAADPSATLIEADDAKYDAQWDGTIAGRRPEDAAVRDSLSTQPPPPSQPVPASSGDLDPIDDHTVFRPRKPAATAPPPPAGIETPVARLVMSNGKEILVRGPILIGRSPQARNTAGGALPLPVPVDDEYVSGTHLELNVSNGTLTATDVSRNGTTLTAPGAPRTTLPKNLPTPIGSGSVLHISDDTSIEVTLL